MTNAIIRSAILISTVAALFILPFQVLALCVTADHATMRSGPGKQFRETWTVGRYMPLKKIARKGSWYQVSDVDGETHWVAASLVSETANCVVVKSKFTNLRQGPGRDHPLAEFVMVDRYTPFRKLEREGSWIQVEDDYKEKYWISDSAIWYPVNHMKISF